MCNVRCGGSAMLRVLLYRARAEKGAVEPQTVFWNGIEPHPLPKPRHEVSKSDA